MSGCRGECLEIRIAWMICLATNEEFTSSNSGHRAATKDDDPATHQNEGFLKSIWHNLTNHPAHRDSMGGSNTEEKRPEDNQSGAKAEKPKNPNDD